MQTRPPRMLVVVGSTNSARRPRNPWTFDERAEMIRDSIANRWETPDPIQEKGLSEELYVCLGRYQPLSDAHLENMARIADLHGQPPAVEIVPLPDLTYSMDDWLSQVHTLVAKYEPENSKVRLVGHTKDAKTNDYLNLFPNWKFLNMPAYMTPTKAGKTLDATAIRQKYFNTGMAPEYVPSEVHSFLNRFRNTDDFEYLLEYHRFVRRYQEENIIPCKYPPIFQTVDACVVQNGHVLVVKRLAQPGRGLWALPGGYVNARTDLSLEDAALRELVEETQIELTKETLKRCITNVRTYDDLHRSDLGRLMTTCHTIKLRPGPFPKCHAADDAADFKWMLLDEARNNCHLFHDDHGHIIRNETVGM